MTNKPSAAESLLEYLLGVLDTGASKESWRISLVAIERALAAAGSPPVLLRQQETVGDGVIETVAGGEPSAHRGINTWEYRGFGPVVEPSAADPALAAAWRWFGPCDYPDKSVTDLADLIRQQRDEAAREERAERALRELKAELRALREAAGALSQQLRYEDALPHGDDAHEEELCALEALLAEHFLVGWFAG